ncbi:hypothetical protein XAV_08010 [Xanthomonas axonopodis pv. vasculorum]|nr:hypothetical protein XAV_08010 [Xanthomonas axonopodis pv. vasculorum]
MSPHSEPIVSRICGTLFRGSFVDVDVDDVHEMRAIIYANNLADRDDVIILKTYASLPINLTEDAGPTQGPSATLWH